MNTKVIFYITLALVFLWGGFYVGSIFSSDWWGVFPLVFTTLYGVVVSVVLAIKYAD